MLRHRIQPDLTDALRRRDASAIRAIRATLAALANAEAVPAAGTVEVVKGYGDVERRSLTRADETAIVRQEIEERTVAADEYQGLGRPDVAAELRAEIAVLEVYLRAG